MLGLYPTDIGSKTFNISPNFGKYKKIHAKAPIGDGIVTIDYENGKLNVTSTASGGTLEFKGEKIPLLPGKTVTL